MRDNIVRLALDSMEHKHKITYMEIYKNNLIDTVFIYYKEMGYSRLINKINDMINYLNNDIENIITITIIDSEYTRTIKINIC